ncbi:MAG: beta-lactamase family protein [Microscillaceae bacterium]|nr:beta-lactamase family protein [Microscillaceae bacterium]
MTFLLTTPLLRLVHNLFLGLLVLGLALACNRKPPAQNRLALRLDSLRKAQVEIKKAKIDLILNRLQEKGLFNGNLLVMENGEVLLHQAYGFADFRDSTRLDTQTVFSLGGISATFTAMAILTLVQKKRLGLRDTLGQYFPRLPYPSLRVQQLLSHTSGLPDYVSYFYTASSEMMTFARLQNVLAWLENEKPNPDFAPGTDWAYSATNYVLLAALVEKITKTSFPKYLQKAVLKPLGLRRTYLPDFSQKRAFPNQAIGFQSDRKTLFHQNFLDRVYGEQGVFASTTDLLRWAKAWEKNRLIGRPLAQKAQSPTRLSGKLSYPYGWGWHLGSEFEEIYHAGGWLGFKSMLIRNPKRGRVLILLTNHNCPVFEELVGILRAILDDRPFRRPSWLY